MHNDEDIIELFKNNTIEKFLHEVNINDIENPRTRAIVSALDRSINVLTLECRPIPDIFNSKLKGKIKAPQQQ
jgi:hypothetical protein